MNNNQYCRVRIVDKTVNNEDQQELVKFMANMASDLEIDRQRKNV
ncbi:hypothetical protein GCM10010976_24470 [Bizionia arctica]|uniref:Uncharacterized protein n=1 Tax=Bizionia arctica TaxID=1495645 RepID=A0A917GNN2_9FLAO|nr:hypothetical protein GCM10010976_24470 [Bizionia arctica]